jgi:FKBP-type peptidyl-prolyl cis-trans isomerase FkpA
MSGNLNKTIFALLLCVLLMGCSKKDEQVVDEPEREPATGPPAVEEPAVVVAEPKPVTKEEIMPGLEKKILRAGEGQTAAAGDSVEVHYTGWLSDPEAEDGRGDKFDSSVDRGETFQFPLGEGRVIKGWDQGVEGMLVGEVRELTIAPELAYGDRGAGAVIPPGATLVFEIELFGVGGEVR